MQKLPTEQIKQWFLENRRSFPWREDPTPYRVWVSEIMLQQTQAAVVVPYFEKWMKLFPTVAALAEADISDVLKCWEGLGYYSRARNLHSGAREIVAQHHGQIPSTIEKLSQIKGIGPYTVGAIRSFAFHEKAAAVDGNVLRVLSRALAFDEEIDLPKTRMRLTAYAEEILPDDEPWLITEALIELGATICSKKPKCMLCPLKKECLGFRHGLTDQLPKKRKKIQITQLQRLVAVIHYRGHYLVCQQSTGQIMAGLYEFPYLELEDGEITTLFEKKLNLKLHHAKTLPVQEHSFTRFKAKLIPYLLEAEEKNPSYLWKNLDELDKLPFSSGHRRILNNLLTS